MVVVLVVAVAVFVVVVVVVVVVVPCSCSCSPFSCSSSSCSGLGLGGGGGGGCGGFLAQEEVVVKMEKWSSTVYSLASPAQTWHMLPESVMICEGPLICSLMARELRGSRYEGLHHGRTEKGSSVSLTACAPRSLHVYVGSGCQP